MKPPPFQYHRPDTVAQVLGLLAQHGADCRILAGGQSLVPMLNLRLMRPAVLIDLNACPELDFIAVRGSMLTLGAMVRQINAVRSEVVVQHCPMIAQALSWAGPVAVRSRATVGGTLAHADRVAELPAVALAMDAVLVIESLRGRREVPASEFFLGDLTTVIEPDEFLREVHVPTYMPHARSVFHEVSVRREGVAVVGLAAYLARSGNRIDKLALVAMGVDSVPRRLFQAEAVLTGGSVDPRTIDHAASAAFDELDPASDPYASAGYRRHVVSKLVHKALNQLVSEGPIHEH
jgi:carbon-monoxide dehydrogenase medium subunit